MALGENELWADLTWIRALVYYGDGLVHDTGMPDIAKLIGEVNAMNPPFRRPYTWGAYATVFRKRTATQEEYVDSIAILRRGVAAFPKDWELHWTLGIRLYFDLRVSDVTEQRRVREEGAALIERAARLPGAPPNLAFTAASMRITLGQQELARRGLRELLLMTEDPAARQVLQDRYAALDSEEAGRAAAEAAAADEAEWKSESPWAPRSLHYILGSLRSGIDLRRIARGDEFVLPTDSDLPAAGPAVHTSEE